eukprot:1140331-Pelagomonas_calceolata.AAC.2
MNTKNAPKYKPLSDAELEYRMPVLILNPALMASKLNEVKRLLHGLLHYSSTRLFENGQTAMSMPSLSSRFHLATYWRMCGLTCSWPACLQDRFSTRILDPLKIGFM